MRTPPVLLILVDGLGYDFIDTARTPNLFGLGKRHRLLPLQPALGYSDAQRAVLFTGRQPDRMGYWMLYRFSDPRQSPWRWLGSLAPMDTLPGDMPRRMFKFGLSASVMKALARRGGHESLNIHNIPFRALPWHSPTLRESLYAAERFGEAPTLFSLLRREGRRYAILRGDTLPSLLLSRSVTHYLPTVLNEIASLPEDTAFTYIYLHTPDLFAHRYGIRDPRFTVELGAVDRAVAAIIDQARDALAPDLQVLVASDHGMNHTERFVSFQRLVTHRGFGREFVVALDSTMVRLWYLSAQGRPMARPLVESTGLGRFLTHDERRELGVDFPPDHYGEDIYLLEPGVSIYPNFHSLMKPLAMHAYHPEVPDQNGIALFMGERLESAVPGPRPRMSQLFDVLCAPLALGASV